MTGIEYIVEGKSIGDELSTTGATVYIAGGGIAKTEGRAEGKALCEDQGLKSFFSFFFFSGLSPSLRKTEKIRW
jgi:hypothetical protein